MTPSYMLCRGRTVVLSDLTIAEAMVETCELKDNPKLVQLGYEVVAVEGDNILGRVGFDAKNDFVVVSPSATFAGSL